METFISYKLNKAAWNQEQSKIISLGPFGIVLNQIIIKS
jgi:hypothetical protein